MKTVTWLVYAATTILIIGSAGCQGRQKPQVKGSVSVRSAEGRNDPHVSREPASETELGPSRFGISIVSAANARENPGHKSELGTQVLLGHSFRLLKQSGGWFLVETEDGYRAWLLKDTFSRCTAEQINAWTNSSLLVVTAMETIIHSRMTADSEPVCDVGAGCLVKKLGENAEFYTVELPDGRSGYLGRAEGMSYKRWWATREPSAGNIEKTARRLMGRPYLWGGNSAKAMDCSGFTKLVFFLNGIHLRRNASQQAEQGTAVDLTGGLLRLKPGDLVFFGWSGKDERPERVTHVGIYLGDGQFIHSAGRVQIGHLESGSPLPEEGRRSLLLLARRILPMPD